jgi:hypothetical protein
MNSRREEPKKNTSSGVVQNNPPAGSLAVDHAIKKMTAGDLEIEWARLIYRLSIIANKDRET